MVDADVFMAGQHPVGYGNQRAIHGAFAVINADEALNAAFNRGLFPEFAQATLMSLAHLIL